MERFVFSIIRCVPEPRTGEFVNVGAIVGGTDSGEWATRQISNEARIRRLAGSAELGATHQFLAWIGQQIDDMATRGQAQDDPAFDAEGRTQDQPVLNDAWLAGLARDYRNVVQLTEPMPVLAPDAETALDVVFNHMILDPVSQPRDFITKNHVISELRQAYASVDIAPELIRPRAEIIVGDHVRTMVDIAIANGRAVQLTQAWSFQRASIEQIATEVKAWGYAIGRLRDGLESRLVDNSARVSYVPPDVDVEVVIAKPKNDGQGRVFEEAEQVFAEVGAHVVEFNDVREVSDRAFALIGS